MALKNKNLNKEEKLKLLFKKQQSLLKKMEIVMTQIIKLSESSDDEESYICEYGYKHGKYNKETLEAMDNVLKGKNLTTYENEEELFKSWGL